jgi:hypothetical protein
MGRKNDERQERVRWEGWSSACQLYEQLAAGASLVELPPSGMRLNVDEIPYADTILGYSRFYGMDVTYHQNSLLLFGPATFVAAGLAVNAMTNASARRRANAMAAAPTPATSTPTTSSHGGSAAAPTSTTSSWSVPTITA